MKKKINIFTKTEIKKCLRKIGLKTGSNVMIHASLGNCGYFIDGPYGLIESIIECVDIKKGTLLMPGHSGQMTDPLYWKNPGFKKTEAIKIKMNMPAFNKFKTQVRNRGILPLIFMNLQKVQRSNHPLNSVLAIGKNDKYFVNEHNLHESEGLKSPIGKLYKKNGKILLIGVTLKNCTAIHLAEFLADVNYLNDNNPIVLKKTVKGKNIFVKLKKYPSTSEYFDRLIPILSRKKLLKKITFGNSHLILFDLKPVIDFILSLLKKDPNYLIRN